jgi:tripartite ATP-independent transporter DctM subunit
MDPFIVSLLLIATLLVCGQAIGIAMLVGSIAYLGLKGFDTSIAAETMLQALFNSYTLLAIPLFILAADLMNIGSLADQLLRFSNALVGRFRGGQGHVNVVSSVIFSGMSGSAVADVVGMGKLSIEMMTRNGAYTPSYAAAITAATAVIGPIIPPSIPMVIYALVSDASIGFLFAAGILPGLLMAASMSVANTVIAHRRDFPRDQVVPLRDLPRLTWQCLPALMLPVILLGGIYSGIVTPTEAAAAAALYALLVSVVLYRSVSARQFFMALVGSARNTAAVGILVAGAISFNYVITRENIPSDLAAWLSSMDMGPLLFLIVVNLLLLALGCVLDAGAILLIVVPVLVPGALALGIDPVHFGVIVVVNTMIGLVTPPYGLLLFIVANITRAPLWSIIVDLMPFLVALLLSLALITASEDFVLWLPRLLGYEG